MRDVFVTWTIFNNNRTNYYWCVSKTQRRVTVKRTGINRLEYFTELLSFRRGRISNSFSFDMRGKNSSYEAYTQNAVELSDGRFPVVVRIVHKTPWSCQMAVFRSWYELYTKQPWSCQMAVFRSWYELYTKQPWSRQMAGFRSWYELYTKQPWIRQIAGFRSWYELYTIPRGSVRMDILSVNRPLIRLVACFRRSSVGYKSYCVLRSSSPNFFLRLTHYSTVGDDDDDVWWRRY